MPALKNTKHKAFAHHVFEGDVEKAKARARHGLTQIIPFEEWKSRRNPTPEQEALYHRVVAELEEIASGALDQHFAALKKQSKEKSDARR